VQRRESFELDDLVELYSRMQEEATLVIANHVNEVVHDRGGGKYGTAISYEESERELATGAKIRRLSGLVLDDALRNLVRDAALAGIAIFLEGWKSGRDAAERASLAYTPIIEAGLDAISAQIRSIHAASAPQSIPVP
jgi:hypothetical protein